jgi:hypothetical protein
LPTVALALGILSVALLLLLFVDPILSLLTSGLTVIVAITALVRVGSLRGRGAGRAIAGLVLALIPIGVLLFAP